MNTVFWIETAWGDSVENATMSDVKIALQQVIEMDDEHGAFWAGTLDEENVLEVHKDLKIFFIKNEEHQTAKLKTWDEAEKIFEYFFTLDFVKVRALLKTG